MKVMQILKLKGSTAVETIEDASHVSDAVARLSTKRIGALVVTDARGSMVGIISERDIVRQIGKEGAVVLNQQIRAIMTSKVSTCTPDEDALQVLDRMTSGRFRHMPVMLRGQIAGILSIGDVVKARIEEIEAENEAMAHMLSG